MMSFALPDNCFTGAARGADTAFGIAADAAGHMVYNFSFDGHSIAAQATGKIVTLQPDELRRADDLLKEAAGVLKRTFPTRQRYVNNLLRRNYYQVLNAERVFAVATFDEQFHVNGGTGWAVEMAIQLGIDEIYVYDQLQNLWFSLTNATKRRWESITGSPVMPYGNYAGIGSRDLTDDGINAIAALYTY